MFRSLALATATCSAVGAALTVPGVATASTTPFGATRVVSLKMPRSGEVHSMSVSGRFPITGMVQQWDGARWTPLPFAHLRFFWRTKGSTVWHDDGQDVFTRKDGTIRASTGVIPGTWSLRAHVLAEPSGTLASTSAAVTTTLTDKVRFSEARAWRSHVNQPTQVTGEMTDYIAGLTFASLRGREVRLYYRRKGTKTWHFYKTTTLRAAKVGNEWFAFNNLKRGKGYYFRVVFPAQGFFLGATSRTLPVRAY